LSPGPPFSIFNHSPFAPPHIARQGYPKTEDTREPIRLRTSGFLGREGFFCFSANGRNIIQDPGCRLMSPAWNPPSGHPGDLSAYIPHTRKFLRPGWGGRGRKITLKPLCFDCCIKKVACVSLPTQTPEPTPISRQGLPPYLGGGPVRFLRHYRAAAQHMRNDGARAPMKKSPKEGRGSQERGIKRRGAPRRVFFRAQRAEPKKIFPGPNPAIWAHLPGAHLEWHAWFPALIFGRRIMAFGPFPAVPGPRQNLLAIGVALFSIIPRRVWRG